MPEVEGETVVGLCNFLLQVIAFGTVPSSLFHFK